MQSLIQRLRGLLQQGTRGDACRLCGRTARLQEYQTESHVFCTHACQLGFYALGMKRSLLQIIEGVDWFQNVDDDLLCVMLLTAFHTIDSVESYDELLAIRRVAARFQRVVDNCVVPRMEELHITVVRALDDDALARFGGLRRLFLDRYAAAITGDVLARLPLLETLTVEDSTSADGWMPPHYAVGVTDAQLAAATNLTRLRLSTTGTIDGSAFQALSRLTALELYHGTGVRDHALHHLGALRSLTVGELETLRDLSPLTALTELEITDSNSSVSPGSLVGLSNLRRLFIPEYGWIQDAELARLTQLEELQADYAWVSADGLSALTNLRVLSCDQVSDGDLDMPAALASLTRLERLCVAYTHYEMDADDPASWVSRLRNLRWLDASDSSFPGAAFYSHATDGALSQLTYLDLSVAHRNVADWDLRALRNLQTLLLDEDDGYRDEYTEENLIRGELFSQLEALHSLSLVNNRSVGNEAIAALTGLRRLDLSRNTTISDYALRDLSNLEELYLMNRPMISHATLQRLPRLRLVVVEKNREADRALLRARGIDTGDSLLRKKHADFLREVLFHKDSDAEWGDATL